MSINLLNRGWRFSRAKGGDLLVLLGIADFANDDGIAYPSIATLARKARLTPRNTQRAIRRLVAISELSIEEGKGPHGTHLYRIILREGDGGGGCHNVRVTTSQDDICKLARVTYQPPKPLKRTVINKDIERNDDLSLSDQSQDAPKAVSHAFEEFWKLYPARGGKKHEPKAALEKFLRLTQADRQSVMVAVKNYAASEMVSKGFGIKDPHRWLLTGKKDQPWRDWITPEELTNGHGQALTCTHRFLPHGTQLLRTCGNPASPDSKQTDPRCSEHLSRAPLSSVETNNHVIH